MSRPVRLPDFIIVGTAKSGTTTLKEYLRHHPDVFMARMEVRYFAEPQPLEAYERWFEAAGNAQLVGEKSPSYCYVPEVPSRIHALLPNARLIWLFREPIARAYSHYWHSVSRGMEPLSFRRALDAEERRTRVNPLRGAYRKRGLYAEQVERYLRHFPREQMLFLKFEDLRRDPASVFEQASRFLGIPAVPYELPPSNQTRIPRSIPLQFWSRRLLGRSRPYKILRRLNRRSAPGYPPMSKATRQWLVSAFEDSNRRLATLTGLDLAEWKR